MAVLAPLIFFPVSLIKHVVCWSFPPLCFFSLFFVYLHTYIYVHTELLCWSFPPLLFLIFVFCLSTYLHLRTYWTALLIVPASLFCSLFLCFIYVLNDIYLFNQNTTHNHTWYCLLQWRNLILPRPTPSPVSIMTMMATSASCALLWQTTSVASLPPQMHWPSLCQAFPPICSIFVGTMMLWRNRIFIIIIYFRLPWLPIVLGLLLKPNGLNSSLNRISMPVGIWTVICSIGLTT